MAETILRQSLEIAREQGALSWELRAATSMARLRRQQGRVAEARGLLEPVFRRFTEGSATADLVRAAALIKELGGAPGELSSSESANPVTDLSCTSDRACGIDGVTQDSGI